MPRAAISFYGGISYDNPTNISCPVTPKITIDDTLDAMQRIVGGPIQAVYPFKEPVALICHEEGKLLHLPLNRALRSPDTGEIYDIIAGDFFLCAAPPGQRSLREPLRQPVGTVYPDFLHPELFLSGPNSSIIVLPMPGASRLSPDETALPENLVSAFR